MHGARGYHKTLFDSDFSSAKRYYSTKEEGDGDPNRQKAKSEGAESEKFESGENYTESNTGGYAEAERQQRRAIVESHYVDRGISYLIHIKTFAGIFTLLAIFFIYTHYTASNKGWNTMLIWGHEYDKILVLRQIRLMLLGELLGIGIIDLIEKRNIIKYLMYALFECNENNRERRTLALQVLSWITSDKRLATMVANEYHGYEVLRKFCGCDDDLVWTCLGNLIEVRPDLALDAFKDEYIMDCLLCGDEMKIRGKKLRFLYLVLKHQNKIGGFIEKYKANLSSILDLSLNSRIIDPLGVAYRTVLSFRIDECIHNDYNYNYGGTKGKRLDPVIRSFVNSNIFFQCLLNGIFAYSWCAYLIRRRNQYSLLSKKQMDELKSHKMMATVSSVFLSLQWLFIRSYSDEIKRITGQNSPGIFVVSSYFLANMMTNSFNLPSLFTFGIQTKRPSIIEMIRNDPRYFSKNKRFLGRC